jgi:tetratricopeptide (TPR) repeat protein
MPTVVFGAIRMPERKSSEIGREPVDFHRFGILPYHKIPLFVTFGRRSCKDSFTPEPGSLSLRIYMKHLNPPSQIPFFLMFLALFASCHSSTPAETVRAARDLWTQNKEKEACERIAQLSGDRIASWRRSTAWEWLRFSAMCATQSGRPLPQAVAKLPSPFGPYAQAMTHFHEQRPAAALRILEKLVASHADDREPAYRLGLILLLDERFEAALLHLQSALTDPQLRTEAVRLALARCFIGLGQLDRVVPALSPLVDTGTVSEISSARSLVDMARAWNRRLPPELVPDLTKVRTMLKAEEPAAALDELEKIMQKYTNIALLHYLRGVIHLRLGNRPDAVVELENALRLEPGDPEALLLLGNIYFHAQREVEARRYLERALEANPFLTHAWRLLRDLHAKNQAYTLAVETHRRHMKLLKKRDATADLLMLAQLQESAGLFDDALSTHRTLVSRLGDEEAFSSLLGLARLHLSLAQNQLSQALAHRRKARTYLERAEKIRATDAELARLQEIVFGPGRSAKTKFEKNLRSTGGRPAADDSNLFE